MHYCNHIMVIWNKNQWTEIRGHVIWCNLQLGHIEICRRTCTKCLLSERTSSKKVNGSERINLFYISGSCYVWYNKRLIRKGVRAIFGMWTAKNLEKTYIFLTQFFRRVTWHFTSTTRYKLSTIITVYL